MRRIDLALALVIGATGCSALFDGSSHMSGGDDGGGVDASTGLDAGPPASCASHEECLVTQAEAHVCVDGECVVGCEEDDDCEGHPFGAICADGDCGCDGDDDCGDEDFPRCAPDGTCGECGMDEHCTDAGAPFCDDVGFCVACRSAADCGGTTPVCDDDGECVGCAEDDDCVDAPGGAACDVGTGACVECADDEDCGAGERCAASTCVSASCDTDGDGAPADRAECVISGTPPDCDDEDADRFPGNVPVCGDGAPQTCPGPLEVAILDRVGAAEIGRLAATEIQTLEFPGMGPYTVSVALSPGTLSGGGEDAYVTWVDHYVEAMPTAMPVRGWDFDGTLGARQDLDLTCPATVGVSTRELYDWRLVTANARMWVATQGLGYTATGFNRTYNATFLVDPSVAFSERGGGCNDFDALRFLAPPVFVSDPGPPFQPGTASITEFSFGGGSTSRTLEVDGVGSGFFPFEGPVSPGQWLVGDAGAIAAPGADDTHVAIGFVDGAVGDGGILTLASSFIGRAAMGATVDASAGITTYALVVPTEGGLERSTWACSETDLATCADAATSTITGGALTADPHLAAASLTGMASGVAGVFERPLGGREVAVIVVPFDGSDSSLPLPLLTGRDHGMADPTFQDVAAASRYADGQLDYVIAAVIDPPSADPVIWGSGVRVCDSL